MALIKFRNPAAKRAASLPVLALLALSAAAVVASAPARSAAATAGADDCRPGGGLTFLCGPKHPEDLAVLPGGRWLIVTGMAEGGGMHLVDAQAKTWTRWFATPARTVSRIYTDCKAAPERDNFLAHGLSLRPDGKGRARLYVVNHGGRETIEVFNVDARGARPSLTWLGCVAMPKPLAANSVAGLPDGSLLATVLTHPGTSIADSFSGVITGAVYAWTPGSKGFVRVEGTQLPTDNGIESAPDGKTFYVVSSGRRTVTAFTNTNPAKALGVAQLTGFTPDNVHWWDDGRLVAAGMTDDEPACGGPPRAVDGKVDLGACDRGYGAALIDPAAMTVTPLASGPRTPPYSGATIAAKAGGALWLGSFLSDRLAYRPLP